MVDGSCHGVRRTKEGPGQAQNGVETLMHRAWFTHHHCPLALEQSVMGGAGINVNKKIYKKSTDPTGSQVCYLKADHFTPYVGSRLQSGF